MNFAFVLILALLPSLGLAEGEMNEVMDVADRDEKAIEELTEAREERQKSIGKVAEITEKSKEALDPVEALKKLGYDGFSPAALFNQDALAIMEKSLKTNNLKNYPPEVVKEEILKSLRGNPLETVVRGSPDLQNFLVDVMRDEKALVGVIKILQDKERLKKYLYFWIWIMFAAYYTRKLFVSKYWKGPFKSFARLVFAMTVSVITVSTFGLIFKPELSPLVSIFRKHI